MKLSEVARSLGCSLQGDGEIEIEDVAALEDAGPRTLTFLADKRYLPLLGSTRAGAVILATDGPVIHRPTLRAANPYVAFADAIALFHPTTTPAPSIHPSAVISASAQVGPDASIGPHAVIGQRVRLGPGARLGANVTIADDVTAGDVLVAHAGVVIAEGVTLGDRVTLHAGAVIGSEGFGFIPLPTGHKKIPQVGTVVIGNDVEIGANATVDRAQLGATVIGDGTKIDNLVQIAHGCRIGPACLVAAQSGLGGSTIVGAGVMLGGQMGSAGHLTIGGGARVAAKAGVHQDVPPGAAVGGYPALDARAWRRAVAVFRRLPELVRRLRVAEKRLGIAARDDHD